jgi:hypothetical protein
MELQTRNKKKQEETREWSWGLYRKSLRESLNPTMSLSQPLPDEEQKGETG